jgi:hypothetical protein
MKKALSTIGSLLMIISCFTPFIQVFVKEVAMIDVDFGGTMTAIVFIYSFIALALIYADQSWGYGFNAVMSTLYAVIFYIGMFDMKSKMSTPEDTNNPFIGLAQMMISWKFGVALPIISLAIIYLAMMVSEEVKVHKAE